jgi:hypothetical protein
MEMKTSQAGLVLQGQNDYMLAALAVHHNSLHVLLHPLSSGSCQTQFQDVLVQARHTSIRMLSKQ